jgi:hypothetical protein
MGTVVEGRWEGHMAKMTKQVSKGMDDEERLVRLFGSTSRPRILGLLQVFQLALATSESSGDLPKGMGSAQLTKQHGDKLAPAGKSFGMTFSMGFFHHVLELDSRKEL